MGNKIVNEYRPYAVSHPGETLLDLIEEKNMSQAELSERTGRPKKTINEIVKGKSSITPETALQLERVLGVPASFWNNRQKRYDEYAAREAEKRNFSKKERWMDSFPVKEMITRGWIRESTDKIEQLNEILKFFGVNSPDEWSLLWVKPSVVYRKSKAFITKPEAASVWLRRGELMAEGIDCEDYNKNVFKNALTAITRFTVEKPDFFEKRMIQLCAEAGVALVFVPPLRGVPVYGITRWLNPNKALIQLSLRGKYEDIFWFTFFHEAAHILLHGKRDVFIEAENHKDEKELQADSFARDFLIPQEQWKRFLRKNAGISKKTVAEFAAELKISSAIVIGRLQHENIIPHSHLNELRRKFDFVNED